MKILVTGGAGFIGSHIVDAYVAEGHEVVVVDDLSSGKKQQVHPDASSHYLDIRDPKLEDLIRKENFEVINHHAGQISVTQSVADPEMDAGVNILGSLKLLQLAKDSGVGKFIFASTGGAIYGEQEHFPAGEDHPCRPLNPYGIAKFSVENYIRYYQETIALRPVILRYANVYGPRQDPHGEAGVVAIFCNKLLQDQSPVIFGDGEQTRDFVAVSDVARANVLALSESCHGTFNIGTGREITVNALTEQLKKISGKNIATRHNPPRKGEQRRSVIDYRKFNENVGWEPTCSLEEGLQKTYDFFLNNL